MNLPQKNLLESSTHRAIPHTKQTALGVSLKKNDIADLPVTETEVLQKGTITRRNLRNCRGTIHAKKVFHHQPIPGTTTLHQKRKNIGLKVLVKFAKVCHQKGVSTPRGGMERIPTRGENLRAKKEKSLRNMLKTEPRVKPITTQLVKRGVRLIE